ncbi:MAG: TIGR04282 family arsenosugar biosynthesis glycosyltransferase [Oceanibaculum nanhaiense]|jgi:rSAM/selenodomain-associated transferase 1|uniref:TIGR04282 family arsenosugar biosynthesis glycosyltransferase n=1 Tax=Oceanibaculum nanhaiense TaxID=1909734 RepID=UPI0032ECCADE
MRGRPNLIVFAKQPRIGRVKSRLARDIGRVPAWRFYRAQLAGLLRRLGRDPRWRCWLAVTPDSAVSRHRWPAGWHALPQGPGDLGARMLRAFKRMPPGPALLIGSDIPEVSRRNIAGAFRLLKRHDAVLGPAGDGGYWLIGLNQNARPRRLDLSAVRWSGPQAMADTRRAMGGLSVGLAATLEDIDTGADLARWRERQKATG